MSPTTLVATVPATIGRYEVLELLGQGTMGVVYRARDPLLGRIVAIKVMQSRHEPAEADLRKCRESFLREARAAAKLDHPHIVRVFDVGASEDGSPFLVMEHMAGPSLERVMLEFQLDGDQILRLVEQLVSAVDTANAAGIVHRDIKPANILFTEDGEIAKIADFGIARFVDSAATQDVARMATPIYMSPEQASGRRVDGKADLFSLGVLCYHLFARRPPFQGEDPIALAYQVVHATHTPLSQLVPGLPTRIDPVIDRILAKDPAERYPSGRDFLVALRYALQGISEPSGEVAPSQEQQQTQGGQVSLEVTATAGAAADPSPEGSRPPERATRAPSVSEGSSGVRQRATSDTSERAARIDTRARTQAAPSRLQPEPGRQPPLVKPRLLRPLWLIVAAIAGVGLLWLVIPSSRDESPSVPRVESATPLPSTTSVENSSPTLVVSSPAESSPQGQVVGATSTAPTVPKSLPRRPVRTPTPNPKAAVPSAAAPSVEVAPPTREEPRPPTTPLAAVATGDLLVRLRHRIGSGELTVLVDSKPVVTGSFSKKKLDFVKVSAWEPVPLAPGVRSFSATLTSTKGKSYTLEPVAVEVKADQTATVTLGIKKGRIVLLDTETEVSDDEE